MHISFKYSYPIQITFIIIVIENVIHNLSSNPTQDCLPSLCTNAIQKVMNPSILPSVMGK